MTRRIKPYWQIEMAAENMLKHCDCYAKPYAGIDYMIASCNIDLIPLDLDNDRLLGVLGKDDNGCKFIGYNKKMIPERILFTKAHELGHFILEHKLDGEILTESKLNSRNLQETEANVFAAALLIPKKLVFKVINESISIYNVITDEKKFVYENLSLMEKELIIEKMKNSFRVSKEAIEFRLKNIFS